MRRMNRWIGIVICLSLTLLSRNLSAGTIAYWDFSSDSNGVTDVSGYFHTLVNNGVVISNGAAVFDGTHTDTVFSTADTLDLSGYSKLTVECFVRTTSPNTAMILEHSEDFNNTSNYGSFFLLSDDTGRLTASFRPTSSYHSDYAPDGTLSDGEWHHVAWVYDSAITTTDRFRLYVDGVQQTQDPDLTSTTPTPLLDRILYIGSRANSYLKFTGEIDDLRISNHARPTSEFLTERTVGEAPVIAHWKFDESAPYADDSGNGNTLTGSGVTFTDGIAFFDGNQSAFNTAANLNLSAYDNLTVECFIRTTSVGMIVEHSPNINAPNAGGFFLNMNADYPGRIEGTIKTANHWHSDNCEAGVMNDGQWHHVAWVYNSNINNTYRYNLYVDGVLQLQNPATTSVTPTALRNDILYIGSRGNSSMQFAGEIDELRITGRALAPVQFLKAPSTEMPEVIAYWPFSTSAPLTDASGNGHSLTNAGVTFEKGAAVFDGTHTAFSTQPSTLNLYPYSALTVEYFIKSTATESAIVIEHTDKFWVSGNLGGFISTLNENNSGQLSGGFSFPSGEFNIDYTLADTVLDGLWHHVAIVYDSDTDGGDRVRLYFDGIQQYEGDKVSDAGTIFLNDVLYIGSRADTELKFVGQLDDIKITGAVLTPAEFMNERSGVVGTLILIF